MKKQSFAVFVFVVLLIPQITFAAWWNPTTWSIWSIFVKPPQQSQQVNPLPKQDNPVSGNSSITPTTTKNAPKNSGTSATTLTKLNNAQIIKKISPAVVYIETDEGSGSGMVFTADGYILTNAHVVEGFTNVQATLQNGNIYPAVVVGRDENADLAVLKIDGSQLPTVQFGDSNKLNQGDEIFTFGFPFGIKGDVAFKDGTVSRKLQSDNSSYIEISAEIHPGNSGGPLVNQYGQVVGVNSATFGKSIQGVQLGETIKFAIPINVALSLIPKLKGGLNVTAAVQKPQVDIQRLCADVKNEQASIGSKFTDLSNEYFEISKMMTNTQNGSGASSLDTFKIWYQNWVNIYDQVSSKTKDMQQKAKYVDFANANKDDLLSFYTSFSTAAISLKGYYDVHLVTLRWITTNTYWDDYLKIKAKEMQDSDQEVLQKASDAMQTAINVYNKITKNYSALIAQYKCQ